MKKVIVLIITLLIVTGCSIKEKEKELNIGLMDFEEYKEIDVNQITSIEYSWFNEGGREDKTIEDKDEITRTYNSLKNKTIINTSEMACEDNTKLYIIKTDSKDYRIEIECNILIHNKDRYLLK